MVDTERDTKPTRWQRHKADAMAETQSRRDDRDTKPTRWQRHKADAMTGRDICPTSERERETHTQAQSRTQRGGNRGTDPGHSGEAGMILEQGGREWSTWSSTPAFAAASSLEPSPSST
eukprot:896109-Rhodomonas_salina.2